MRLFSFAPFAALQFALHFRGAHAVIAALLLTVVLVVACSSDPTATPVPSDATDTPVPTDTSVPTPEPPTMSWMMLDENMTGGDLMAMMSAEEIACVQSIVGGTSGGESVPPMQETPIFMLPDSIYGDCFSLELHIMLGIAALSAEIGPLSAESGACLTEIYWEYADTPLDESDPAAELVLEFSFQACLTDEQAIAFSALPGEDEFLLVPSQLECLTSQVSVEDLAALLTNLEGLFADDVSPEMQQTFQELFIASEACGVDLDLLMEEASERWWG